MPSRQLAHLRAPDLAGRLSGRSILIQPLGAIEQHGPHLPLHTDLLGNHKEHSAAYPPGPLSTLSGGRARIRVW